MNKKIARIRRSKRARFKIAQSNVKRLVVHRSNCHIYAQIIDESGAKVLAHASTLNEPVSSQLANGSGGNIKAAKLVGEMIARRAVDLGITRVAFDRSGFKYHGRVRALADSAREHGLSF